MLFKANPEMMRYWVLPYGYSKTAAKTGHSGSHLALMTTCAELSSTTQRRVKAVPYRITTRDGVVFNVEDSDLAVISAYLALEGYPPIRVEPTGPDSLQLDDSTDQVKEVTP